MAPGYTNVYLRYTLEHTDTAEVRWCLLDVLMPSAHYLVMQASATDSAFTLLCHAPLCGSDANRSHAHCTMHIALALRCDIEQHVCETYATLL